MKPFLKWAGGKFRIVTDIKNRLPEGRRLVEPFIGSGAVFLNVEFEEYLLADVNADLITLYRTLQADGPDFITECRELFTALNNTRERYYELRREYNTTADSWRKSVLLVYLNRHCYNGLYRTSRNGFNVPFGRYQRPYFPEGEMLEFHRKAQHAVFVHADFRTVMQQAEAGDRVYCDPPYHALTRTANFTGYQAGGFGASEQIALATEARRLAARSIPVLVSNHDTPFIRDLYQGADILHLSVPRVISRDVHNRVPVGEVLALFRPDTPSSH